MKKYRRKYREDSRGRLVSYYEDRTEDRHLETAPLWERVAEGVAWAIVDAIVWAQNIPVRRRERREAAAREKTLRLLEEGLRELDIREDVIEETLEGIRDGMASRGAR